MKFDVLPYEILMEIFKFLDPICVYFYGKLNRVSMFFYKVIKMDYMWEIWVESIFPNTILKKGSSQSYKSFFIRLNKGRVKDDKEVVMTAINHNPWRLQYASGGRLKDDKEVVLAKPKPELFQMEKCVGVVMGGVRHYFE